MVKMGNNYQQENIRNDGSLVVQPWIFGCSAMDLWLFSHGSLVVQLSSQENPLKNPTISLNTIHLSKGGTSPTMGGGV